MWECRQPSWREDVSREIDLVEEVARFHGLEKFPPRLARAKQPSARLPHAEMEDRLRERLIGLGYQEITSIPLVNEEEDALFRMPGAEPVRISNPLSSDASAMRSSGFISIVHALSWNLNRGQRDLRLFEIGRIYRWNGGAPMEMRVVTVGATGTGAPEKNRCRIAARVRICRSQRGSRSALARRPADFAWKRFLRSMAAFPGQAAQIELSASVASQTIGICGKISTRVADRFKFRQEASSCGGFWLDEFYPAVAAAQAARRYRPISRFPAVERDFSLTLNEGTSFSAVQKAIGALGIAEIASIEALDLFWRKECGARTILTAGENHLPEPGGDSHRTPGERILGEDSGRARTGTRGQPPFLIFSHLFFQAHLICAMLREPAAPQNDLQARFAGALRSSP